jgi:ERCC4-related helicase
MPLHLQPAARQPLPAPLQTKIQAHHSAFVLQRKSTSKIVYLAPTVSLADQQAGECGRSGLRRAATEMAGCT